MATAVQTALVMVRLILVLLAFSLSANSQWVSVGVSGGVPVSPHSAIYQPQTLLLNPTSSNLAANDVTVQAPNDFYQKPYGGRTHGGV